MTRVLVASQLDAAAAVLDQTVQPGEGWMRVLSTGQCLRIVDLAGNQAVDTLFYDAHDAANATARRTRSASRARSISPLDRDC